MKDAVEKLIVLQEKDITLSSIQKNIDAAPAAEAAVRAEIAEVERKFDKAKADIVALEAKRSAMRLERRAMEDKVAKYKYQLPETKNNSDYMALTNEIERLASIASKMESDEIEILFSIDVNKEQLKVSEAQTEGELTSLRGRIDDIQADLLKLQTLAISAQDDYADIESQNSAQWLNAYKRIRATGKKLPIVVPVNKDGTCGGCNLKISGEVTDKLKISDAPVFCEQCGRILFEK